MNDSINISTLVRLWLAMNASFINRCSIISRIESLYYNTYLAMKQY